MIPAAFSNLAILAVNFLTASVAFLVSDLVAAFNLAVASRSAERRILSSAASSFLAIVASDLPNNSFSLAAIASADLT